MMSTPRSVKAWDWPTRAFHWALVVCIVSAWASINLADRIGDITLIWHRWNGFAILVLIVFRVIWGFVGSSTSRFSAFLIWPWTALRFALESARGHTKPYLGHNPVGTWMILALLGTVFIQATIGLFSVTETVAGPLKRLIDHDTSEQITKLHARGVYVIAMLVVIHVSANVLYGTIKKEPLIRAMITGKKPAEIYTDQQEAIIADRVVMRALICLLMAAAIVFGGIIIVGGKLF
jgi:cytochrome b